MATINPLHAIAGRLRQYQDELADRPENERKEQLEDLLQRHTKRMVGDELEDFYDELENLFPAWGEVLNVEEVNTAQKWNDPIELAAQLAKIAGENNNARRPEILQALAGAGLPVINLGSEQRTAVQSIQKILGITTQPGAQLHRLLETCAMLIQSTVLLDNATHPMWKNICPGVNNFQPQTLQEILKGLLTLPDRDPSRPQRNADLDRQLMLMRQRLIGLISTIPQFVRKHGERFAPAEINNSVEGRFGRPQRLWDRYIELCGGDEKEHLESLIRKTFETLAEKAVPCNAPAAAPRYQALEGV